MNEKESDQNAHLSGSDLLLWLVGSYLIMTTSLAILGLILSEFWMYVISTGLLYLMGVIGYIWLKTSYYSQQSKVFDQLQALLSIRSRVMRILILSGLIVLNLGLIIASVFGLGSKQDWYPYLGGVTLLVIFYTIPLGAMIPQLGGYDPIRNVEDPSDC